MDFAIGQHLQYARHSTAVGQLRLLCQGRLFGFGDFQNTCIALGHLINHHIPEMIQQIANQPAQLLAARGQFMQLPQRASGVRPQHGLTQRQHLRLRSETEHRQHVAFLDGFATKTDELIQRALGIPHAAVGTTGNGL